MMNDISQLLSEIENLKKKLVDLDSALYNNEVWSIHHQLQCACAQLLVGFQETALEHGIERDLWNVGFKTTINQLQQEVKTKERGNVEAKEVLNWFLNSASGFYLQLLNQISSVNSLDFVFRRRDSIYGLEGGGLSSMNGVKVKDSIVKNALYLCQYCLIHLGDLARYRNQAKQAETYYRHAVTVTATSGHPYNQLALLEAGRGNRLASVFLYIRSVCVPAPFPGAPSNLLQTLTKVWESKSRECNHPTHGEEVKFGSLSRMTKDDYISLFLYFHSSLILSGDVGAARDALPRLSSALSLLVATTTLTRASLIQMFAINVFSHHYFSSKCSIKLGDENSKTEDERLIDPKKVTGAVDVIDGLMVGMLAALLLPIHTMKEAEVVLTYPALPTIRLIFEWILLEDKLTCAPLKEKQQIWPGLCATVNFLQKPLANSDFTQYKETPLPEDWELQGFQPLAKILCRYKYKEGAERPPLDKYSLLRAKRLTDVATKLSLQIVEGSAVIRKSWDGDQCPKFEAQSSLSPSPEEVLRLERLTLHPSQKEKVGILKPQGSLEKAKENKKEKQQQPKEIMTQQKEREGIGNRKIIQASLSGPYSNSVSADSGSKPVIVIPNSGLDPRALPEGQTHGSTKTKMRTNVALQAILKRNCASSQEQQKQVTFQTPSPAGSPNSESSVGKQRGKLVSPPPASMVPPLESAQTFLPGTNRYINCSNSLPPNPGTAFAATNSLVSGFPSPPYRASFGTPFQQQRPHFPQQMPPPASGSLWNKISPPSFPPASTWGQSNLLINTNNSLADRQMAGISSASLGKQFNQSPFYQPSHQPSPLQLQNPLHGSSFLNQSMEARLSTNSLSNPGQMYLEKSVASLFNGANVNALISTPNVDQIASLKSLDSIVSDIGNAQKDPIRQVSYGNAMDLGLTLGQGCVMDTSTSHRNPMTSSSDYFRGGETPSGSDLWWGEASKMSPMYMSPQLHDPPHGFERNLDAVGLSTSKDAISNLDRSNAPLNSSQQWPSNTYSLFGPLGGGESHPVSHLIPGHVDTTEPRHPSYQFLWSGPSPLQRLLEQKKFSSPKQS